MGALIYGLGGLGQGITQGKQIQYQRGVQQQELGQKSRALDLEQQRMTNEKQVQDRAAAMQGLQGMNAFLQDPHVTDLHSADEIGKVHAARIGLLRAHPDLDTGGEVAALDQRQASAPQIEASANATTQDIFNQPAPTPNQMLESGGGQPIPTQDSLGKNYAPPAPPPGLPPINGKPQAGPVLSTQAAPEVNAPAPHPAPQQGPATTGPQYGPQSVIAGNPDNMMSIAKQWYDMADNAQTPELKNLYFQRGQDAEGKAAALADLQSRTHGTDIHTAVEEAALPGIQPQAEATLSATKAGTAETIKRTGQIEPLAKSAIATQQEQIAASKYERGEYKPEQLRQAAKALGISEAAQRIAAFTAHSNATEADRAEQLACQQYGFTKAQFETTKKGLLAQYAHTQAEAAKLLADPDFVTQEIIKTLEAQAYTESPSHVKTMNGPAAPVFSRFLKAVEEGNSPSLVNPSMSQILGTGPVGPQRPQGFDVNGLMRDKTLTPSQKAETLKRAGVKITPAMAKQLSGGR